MDELRKKKIGTQNKWTLEEIKVGMEEYKKLYSRYPSTLDFDKVDFLPSSRLIQRNYEGIVKLKELLKLDGVGDYTKGSYRSEVAKKMYNNSVSYEEEFYDYLVYRIPEVKVHEHKILRPGHICCDFFVYTSERDGYAIDIFYAQDIYSVGRIIHIKFKRYLSLSCPIYFILVGNKSIDQNELDKLITNRKIPLLSNMRVYSEEYFKHNVL